jgi:phage baseplate assembly protein W
MTAPAPITWPLLATPDADGRLRWPSLEDSVRQRLRVLLATRPGEQLMRPRFGAGLDEVIGEPDTLATRKRIADLVTQAVQSGEPRVLLDGVDVTSDPDHPGLVHVRLAWRLRRTGDVGALNLSLQLLGT